ncbi:MAG: RnfABCDGE type electron transport complex subunit D [Clostridia bacterium]|nr:RnfABCDGE type electron transport complex subunit D [Clostridia bacterium]
MDVLNISNAPHVRTSRTTTTIMADVILALLPACGVGIWLFGWQAALVLALSVGSCVLTEWLYEVLMKKPVTVGDLSAVVTGLILGVNLPASAPWYLPVLGGVFAILVVKMLFGGLGQNFMNPALAARCFLMMSFAGQMTAFPALADMTSGATPLAAAKNGEQVDLLQMLLGQHSGTIGETCAVAILIGFVYLLIRRVIAARIPLVYIGSTVLFVMLFQWLNGNPTLAFSANYLLAQVLGGGLLLGAVFMATDYVTSPITKGGQWLYAILIGFLTALFRVFGSTAEGVSYAIIIANLVVPLIERITVPRPFGFQKGGKTA